MSLTLAIVSSGQVLAGTITGCTRLIDSRSPAVKQKRDFSDVLVWLTSSEEPRPLTLRKRVEMVQKDKRFSPHILAIETGTSVDFPNLDPIFHNAFSNYDGKIFDVALYPPGSSRTVRFDRPGVVRVFCNIHPSMSAIVVVVNSDHFAVTDQNGQYALAHVSPGEYQLHFFHERATPETLAKLTRTIVVGDNVEPLTMSMTTISEAGYLPVAHKNKYGLDYPAKSDRADAYLLQMK